jgi:NAD(P)-dependent dehydrogenase (short-subunit alcohol dehydrogenase family)
MNKFKNKNVVITGAASGIGRAFAIALAQRGANLLISDINLERLDKLNSLLKKKGIKVVSLKCDVSKHLDVKNLGKIAYNEFDMIDYLFSNAGIAVGGPFELLDISQWKRIFNVNVFGMIFLVREFLPKMVKQGGGHIIVTSSIAGTIGIGLLMPYSTTKFANAGFCEALYGEFRERGIKVSIICPFPLKTNLIETVGVSFPPELIVDKDSQTIKKIIDEGKRIFWKEFTREAIDLEKAVEIYIKKIEKEKLYIFERKEGRIAQFLRGFLPNLYKKQLRKLGEDLRSIYEQAVEGALQSS